MRIVKYTTLYENNLPVLVKEKATNYEVQRLTSPSDVALMLSSVFALNRQTEEIVYMVALSAKGNVLGVFEVSRGTATWSAINPREIFLKALLCGAVNIILAHNHPSGDTTPSTEDLTATKRVKEAGKILGLPLLDHVIVGDGYYSLKENNLMED